MVHPVHIFYTTESAMCKL